jgi:hypothetical protein
MLSPESFVLDFDNPAMFAVSGSLRKTLFGIVVQSGGALARVGKV